MTMETQINPLLAPPNQPYHQQGVKGEQEVEDIQEEIEDKVEEAEVPTQGLFRDKSYQETSKMVTILTTNKPQKVNYKNPSMDFHFAITVGDQVTKDKTAQ